jgi:hypothetical protein
MDVVYVGHDRRGFMGEFRTAETLKKVHSRQPPADIRHSRFDELPKLKLLAALGELDRPNLAGPLIDVLEKMMVNGALMREVKNPVGTPSRAR